MEDGCIYLISRTLGDAGPSKTLITGAYNNRGATLQGLSSAFVIRDIDAWANTWGHFNFVQDDDIYFIASYEHLKWYNFYIYPYCADMGYGCNYNEYGCNYDQLGGDEGCTQMCYPCTGHTVPYCWYYDFEIDEYHPLRDPMSTSEYANYKNQQVDRVDVFTFGTPTQSGDITKVTVWAEVRGKAKVRLNSAYGSDEEFQQFTWASLEYTTVPGGGAWAWSNVASGTLKAGVYMYWGEETSGCCRRIKVVITTTTGEITLWPTGDDSSNCRALLVAGNYLEDLDFCDELAATASTDLPVYQAVRTEAAHANKYITSDLSEVAPSFSLIDGVTVSYSYRASTPNTGSYARAYLEIAGTKYYGTSHQLGSTYALLEYTETWATNPATSAAWDYDDYKTARFGLHVYSAADLSYTYLFKLYATAEYRERKFEPSYTKLHTEFDSRTETAQNPLTADELVFFSDTPIPERIDLAYFQHGQIRFLGFVWSYSGSGGRYKIVAKSYLAALDYRHLPDISYSPKTDRLDATLSLNQILSAAPPTRPLHSHLGKLTDHDNDPYEEGEDPDIRIPEWTEWFNSDIVITHESPCGIMFIANSQIPVENGDSTGKVPYLGGLVTGRAIFGLDKMLAQIQAEYNLYLTEDADAYEEGIGDYIEKDIYGAGAPCRDTMYGLTSHSDGFQVAGLRRLAKHTSSTCTDEQYYQAADGSLYVAPWPGSQLILIDGAMDCFVDIDYNELGEWTLNEEVPFSGKVKAALDNVFTLAGLEITATPKLDARIHLDARLSNGRGSAADPLKKFYSGRNCKITEGVPPEPLPDAAIGHGNVERVACDWQTRKLPLLTVINTDQTGEDLQDRLDAVLVDDGTQYTIYADGNDDAALRPLDWIWADDIPVRIQKVVEYRTSTVITAGKRLFRLSEQWGQWRDDIIRADASQSISKTEFVGETFPASSTFVVKAKHYRRGDWVCRFTMAWDITTDGTEIEATTSPKATITLAGRKIGVYLLPGKSGSMTIDISDACAKSISANTTNTISVSLVNHLTGTVHHTLTCTVEQHRIAAALVST